MNKALISDLRKLYFNFKEVEYFLTTISLALELKGQEDVQIKHIKESLDSCSITHAQSTDSLRMQIVNLQHEDR